MKLITPCHYVDGRCRERGSIYTREVDRWRRRRKVLARDLGNSIHLAIYIVAS